MSKIAQDNTDQYEPGRPNYNTFLKVEEEEAALEEEQRAIQKEIEEQKRIIAEQEAEAERIAQEEARLARLAEEEEEEEDSMKISKFMFSGMSFKGYVESIKKTLNKEMAEVC